MRYGELEEEVRKLTRKIGELELTSESNKDGQKEELRKLSSENVRLGQVNTQLESQLKRERVKTFFFCSLSLVL